MEPKINSSNYWRFGKASNTEPISLDDAVAFEHAYNIPPFEAWNDPEYWLIRADGRLNTSRSKIIPPTDDRGFVKVDEFITGLHARLFRPDYKFRRDPSNPESRVDQHHIYGEREMYLPSHHGGNRTPLHFRENPLHVVLMPRQDHNVLHGVARFPEMPGMDDMEEFNDSYRIAHSAFTKLFKAARSTMESSKMFSVRRRSVAAHTIIPRDERDTIAEAFMLDRFTRHYDNYMIAVEEFIQAEHKDIILPNHEILLPIIDRPSIVVRKIGRVVTRKHINLNVQPWTPALEAA